VDRTDRFDDYLDSDKTVCPNRDNRSIRAGIVRLLADELRV